MKQTLLEMTQAILSEMSSDEVNSIGDSPESLQVANIIKTKYYDIISRGQLPEHSQLLTLDASLDATRPVIMYVPQGVSKVEWIKYYDSNVLDDSSLPNSQHDLNVDLQNNSGSTPQAPPGYKYVTMLPIRQFIDMVNTFNPEESTVESFNFQDTSNNYPGSFNFYYKTMQQPSYCCIISNYYVIFDSYDSTQDTTLQTSKSMLYGQVVPIFLLEDSFIPDLDAQQFPLLTNEAKALAFYVLKQQPHALAMQETKRQWSTVQKNKSINNRPTYFNQLPNFGRHAGSYYGTRGFNNGNGTELRE